MTVFREKFVGFGGRRLKALTALAVALGLLAGGTASAEGLQVPGADATAGPARKTGGGFEFRRKLSSVDNPYCAIVTYVVPDFTAEASSTQTADDRSVIVIDASILKTERAYAHFLMAHECCHHTLGHTRLTTQRLGSVGPQPFYYLRPLLKNMELDADGCAVRMLRLTDEPDAIESARIRMSRFGDEQTGAYYPTGNERAGHIERIAAEE
ncbi:hypothetical protein [Methyloceanibacter superfactus]|uniref:hypothetical protein n=1 Tax=Methyloceanibacter superfactus TaxID=1774969 RepID=UPI00114CEF6C|nr:hypothetical protein [Methyloceanibacter superfactus]